MTFKPLGGRAYGSISHLPGSRMGVGDHHCHEGQARIATEKARDRRDQVWVQEKLDGSCVSIYRNDDATFEVLTRAGYRADTSPYEQHQRFEAWFHQNAERFDWLERGERVVGEWLAQAHATRYDLRGRDPFVAFDVMRGKERLPYERFLDKVTVGLLAVPPLLAAKPVTPELALEIAGERGFYGALEPIEGFVWRVERDGKVDFLTKYVRPDKVDGKYLEAVTGEGPVWNWEAA